MVQTVGPREYARFKRAYHRDYASEYQKLYRDVKGRVMRPMWKVTEEGCTYFLVHVIRTDRTILESRWLTVEEATDVLKLTFNCDGSDITVRARGGGRGSRDQPWLQVEGPVDIENWLAGLDALRERATVKRSYKPIVQLRKARASVGVTRVR